MNSDLRTLFGQIRADLGDDFVATEIVGMDGMSIAEERSRPEFDSEIVSAQITMVMKLANRVSGNVSLGAVRDNQLNTEKWMVFSRFLGDGSFFWLLATTKNATLGIVRTLMDEYELRLLGATAG